MAGLALAFIPKTLQKLSIKTLFLINDIFLLQYYIILTLWLGWIIKVNRVISESAL